MHALSSQPLVRLAACSCFAKNNLFGALCCRQGAVKRQAPKGVASRRRQPQGSQKGGRPTGELGTGNLQAGRVKKA